LRRSLCWSSVVGKVGLSCCYYLFFLLRCGAEVGGALDGEVDGVIEEREGPRGVDLFAPESPKKMR